MGEYAHSLSCLCPQILFYLPLSLFSTLYQCRSRIVSPVYKEGPEMENYQDTGYFKTGIVILNLISYI